MGDELIILIPNWPDQSTEQTYQDLTTQAQTYRQNAQLAEQTAQNHLSAIEQNTQALTEHQQQKTPTPSVGGPVQRA